MLPEFYKLLPAEVELMFKAPVLVCILIAGADGHIDNKEIKGAIALTEKKQKRSKSYLLAFYKELGEDFEDKLKIVIQGFPTNEAERSPMIVQALTKINPILKKLDHNFACEFYASLREIASAIAMSSGGLLGMKKVGDEEAKYVQLDMIKDPAKV
ncbi:MAG: hypothetical protein JNM78_09185 [Cyclobacteriaceae bacterium]|nr:hypothetical protein [Cyclobacteriaceae bacterium]